MPKILLDMEGDKIVNVRTTGMKAKPIGKKEKIRRFLTRNRSLALKNKWDRLNTPIKYPVLVT